MNEQNVYIGIIGCGWIAERAHIPSILKCKNAKILAVYDIDFTRASEICDTFNIPYKYDSLEKFWECGINAVVIATPNFTHVEYSLDAIKHGMHVLCEKPIVLHTSDLQQVLRKAKEKNVIYIPGVVNRWRLDIIKAKELIQSGEIGKVKHISAGWLRKCGIPRPGTWFTNKQLSGGGVLLDLGSHVIDICMLFLGRQIPESYQLFKDTCEPQRIMCNSASWFFRESDIKGNIDVEDSIVADVQFKNNVTLSVKLSWMADVEADATYFKIEGEKGNIEIKTLFGFSNQRLWKNDLFMVETEEAVHEVFFDPGQNNTENAFFTMFQHFINAIQNKKNTDIEYDSVVAGVSLIENLYYHECFTDEAVISRMKENI